MLNSMHTVLRFSQGPGADDLSIGQLSEATGVTVGTLRMWETRHGFPRPARGARGHRRFSAADVDAVREVLRWREAGVRLDAAIARVTAADVPPRSVFSEVVARHPEQPRQRLRKSTLIGLSWAIEDEVPTAARPGHLFGAFQHARNFTAARHRWTELSRTSATAHVLLDAVPERAAAGPTLVVLPEDSPMHREWAVVHDSARLSLALTAWEVPGQDDVADLDRLFESVWTVDPGAVRTAAYTCAGVAAAAGSQAADDLLADDLATSVSASPDGLALARVAHRAVAYVEELAVGRRPAGR